MKKSCSITMITLCLLLFTNTIQAQTAQTKLNQVELIKQIIGTWQSNVGNDTVEVWENHPYVKV
jgi:hypothetical protein